MARSGHNLRSYESCARANRRLSAARPFPASRQARRYTGSRSAGAPTFPGAFPECGLVRDRGIDLTSITSSTLDSRNKSTNSTIVLVEWPLVKKVIVASLQAARGLWPARFAIDPKRPIPETRTRVSRKIRRGSTGSASRFRCQRGAFGPPRTIPSPCRHGSAFPAPYPRGCRAGGISRSTCCG